jgi:hypothetical protein
LGNQNWGSSNWWINSQGPTVEEQKLGTKSFRTNSWGPIVDESIVWELIVWKAAEKP